MGEKLEILITAEDAASGVLEGLKGAASGLGSVFGGLLTLGAGAATAAVGLLGTGLALSFKEAMEAEEIASSLAQTLANTGKVTGVTAEMCNELADGLSKVTRFSDDAILAGEDMLAGFNNIGKDVFPKATKAMLDMATKMKIDVPSAARLLGKILNDPAGAAGLLEKQGIKLTDALEKQITAMVKSGDVAGAQSLIMEQLAGTMGGAAEAAGQTLAGRLDILKNRLLNVAEGIGTTLLPIAEQFFNNVVMPAVPLVEQLAARFSALIGVLASGNAQAISFLLPPGTLESIQPLIAAVQNLASAFVEKMPQMQAAGEQLVTWLQGAFGIIGPQILANLTTTINALAELWRQHGDEVIAGLTFVFQIIVATIGSALTLVSGIVAANLQMLSGDWSGAWDTMMQTYESILNMILSITGTNLTEFTAVWQNNWNMLQLIVSTATMQITAGFQTWIINTINSAKTFAGNLIETLKGFYQTFVTIGQQWFDGITQGILMKVTQLTNTVVSSIQDTIRAARNALGIASPSQVFAEVGQQIMAGMAQGITAGVGAPAGAIASATPALTGAAAGGGGGGGTLVIQSLSIATNNPAEFFDRLSEEARRRGLKWSEA